MAKKQRVNLRDLSKTLATPPPPLEKEEKKRAFVPKWRQNKINVTAYVDPPVRMRLSLIQAKKPGIKIQHLVEEALEDLFTKYGIVAL